MEAIPGQLIVKSEERVGRTTDTIALAIPMVSLALVVYAHQFDRLDEAAIQGINQSLVGRAD